MKWLNYITLLHRAYRYKNKHDIGGIHFLLQHTKHGDIAFDIGAHKGGYLYWMQKQIGVRGKAVAFEPQRNLYRNLLELRQNFSWNNVTIENLALNDVVEQSQLFIPTTKLSGSSPGARLMEDVTTADGRLQSIRTITLDEYCLQNNLVPNFLKIDVEGNEWNVLKGAASVLAKCKPTILIEIEARHVGEDVALNTFEWIEQHGYKGYFLAGKQMLPLSSFSFSKHQNLNNKKAYYNNFGFVPSQNK